MLLTLFKILLLIVLLLISVAYFTLAERKILGVIQRRRGPNVIGVFGLLQPLSDGLKLLLKETIIPSSANKIIFLAAPVLTFFISLISWGVISFNKFSIIGDINLGVLYLLSVSSTGVYGIILSGWSSNSKYAFLGALRSTAQMVSYEISLGFIIITILICCNSFNITEIIYYQKDIYFGIPFLPLAIIFFISGLAETNRHPFDLPEAESELVSGYNVEYSAMGFALFSLGEYSNMLLMSSLSIIFFWGGWISFLFYFNLEFLTFSLKLCFFVFLYVLIRAILPRYRYDQLMFLGWKIFLPCSIGYLLLTASIFYSFDI
jgi:NADH-quinone oxidoreductase subunit H